MRDAAPATASSSTACGRTAPTARTPRIAARRIRLRPRRCELTDGVYPDEGLARYEYRKHGTCSGLDPQAYFSAVKTLRDAIVDSRNAQGAARSAEDFARALTQPSSPPTPISPADNMAITCRDGELVDVRVCVAKSLTAFAQCPKVAGHTCHAASISVAPLR